MQNYAQVPIFSYVADWFAYPALTGTLGNDNKVIPIATAFGNAKAYVTLQPEHYFMFCGFACQTNYDNFGGVFKSASVAAAIISQPSVPNAFLVEMQRSSDNNYADIPLTQAEVCSSGLLSGKQAPYPVIYGPSVTLSFKFTDLTGLLRLTQADVAVPLNIQFWMLGYSIPQSFDGEPDSNFRRFLEYFPALKQVYYAPSGQVQNITR
jgi:hypothetical protein